jgi:hypothetical protein
VTPIDDSTKVTTTTVAAKSAASSVETPTAVVETPAKPTNGNGSSPVKQMPVEDRIRIRAYELYLRRGGKGGSPEQDWFQAVTEIYSESVA